MGATWVSGSATTIASEGREDRFAVCDDARMSRPDPYSLLPCMLLDAGVVRDIADALDGRWSPTEEINALRRDRLVEAARLRLYGERSRSGWHVVTYRKARASGLTRGDSDWSVGFLPDVSRFDDGPPDADVEALAQLHLESGMEAEAGLALAYAVLYDPVKALVTTEPLRYRHNRAYDLPEGLRLLSPSDAFGEFGIAPGEAAATPPPPTSPVGQGPAWWEP
jgi:hypothetical protein